MEHIAIVLALLILFIMFYNPTTQQPTTKVRVKGQCPPGYYAQDVPSTWAGWSFDCLPIGSESSTSATPWLTYTRPMTTIYKPMIENTGRARSMLGGEPAENVYMYK